MNLAPGKTSCYLKSCVTADSFVIYRFVCIFIEHALIKTKHNKNVDSTIRNINYFLSFELSS